VAVDAKGMQILEGTWNCPRLNESAFDWIQKTELVTKKKDFLEV
jgi:hypothetical protein